MRARTALVALLAASALLLAGCLASTTPSPVTPASQDGAAGTAGATSTGGSNQSDTPVVPGTNVTADLVHTVDGSTNHDVVVRNGSYTFLETCVPAGCFTGSFEQGLDLTEKLPVGVPAKVNVTLDYDENVGNNVNLDLETDGAEVYSLETAEDFGSNTVWLDATVVRNREDGQVLVQSQVIYPDDGDVSYTMRAEVGAHTTFVPEGVPTAVEVPGEADGFRMGFPTTEGSFDAMVWDPSDRFLGHYQVGNKPGDADEVRVELGPDNPPGEYVVLLSDVEPDVRHTHDADEPHHHHQVRIGPLNATPGLSLDPLEMELRFGGNKTVTSGESVEWQPRFPKAPMRAALIATPPTGVTVNPATLDGELRSPSGTLVDIRSDGFLLGFGGYLWASDVGAEALDDGRYHASFTNGGGTPLEVTHVVASYQR